MAGIYSQGGSAGHRYAGWLSEVEAKNFQFGGKVFNGSPSAIYVGSKMVWPSGWLTFAAVQAILGAFGQRDGAIIIDSINANLNQISHTQGKQAAQAMADYINAYPLAGVYNLDGLVFQMDCDYECSESVWKDLKGGEIFTGTGVSLTNGIPTFNGSARYIKESVLNFAWNTHTIEFAIVRESTSDQEILGNDMYGGIGAIYYSQKWQGVGSSRTTTPCFLDTAGMNVFTTLSIVNSSAYQDKSQITRSGQDYWSPKTSGKSSIGARYNGQNPFKGKIYAIRIYNRLLTEAEILANQDIDLKRFTPSTP